MNAPPIRFVWRSGAMIPRLPELAARHFKEGETYLLEERQERSSASHSHYFAALKEIWNNLPSEAAERFPSVTHFRKFCLIRTGYRDERTFACSTKAEAQRLAAFLKPIDEFALIVTHENTVTAYTARSQSSRAMDKATFQESKDKVLEYAASLVGTTAREAEKASAA